MHYILSDASFRHSDGTGVLAYLILDEAQDLSQPEMMTPAIILETIQEVNNIRCEMRSVLAALKTFATLHPCPRQGLHLYTDCQTITGLASRRARLEKNGFTSGRTGLALHNADLYQQMFKVLDQCRPTLHWIKGHNRQLDDNPMASLFKLVDHAARQRLRQLPPCVSPHFKGEKPLLPAE